MDVYQMLATLPVATWAALIASTIIPSLSSLLTKAHWDSAITGLLTLFLSVAAGFFSEWAKDGNTFQWKAAAGTALLSYGIAVLNRVGWLRGTSLESKLLLVGSKVKEIDTTPEPSPIPETDPESSDVMQLVRDALAQAEAIHPSVPADTGPPPMAPSPNQPNT